MNKIIYLCSIAILAGCTTPAKITQAPISYSKARSFDTKSFKSDTSFVVRTLTKSSGSKAEITGVPCKFQGQGFSATFTSPAVVTAPNFGKKTPTTTLSCTYNEETVNSENKPFNLTTAQISARNQNAVAGHGLLGVLVASVATGIQKSRRDESKDVYAYRSKNVLFGAK